MARERSAGAEEAVSLELVGVPGARQAIAVLHYPPRRARGVAIAVGHGYSSSKQNLDPLCGFLAGHGFRIVSLDFPGHKLGASGGRLDDLADLDAAFAAAVAFARAREPVVYALGHSMGAIAALRAVAADQDIAGAVAIATGAGRLAALEALRGRGAVDLRSSYVDGLGLAELMTRLEPDLAPTLARLAGRPVLYVAAERDMMVTRASAEALFAQAPEPKSFATVPSDHTNAGEASRAAVLAWFNERAPRADAPTIAGASVPS